MTDLLIEETHVYPQNASGGDPTERPMRTFAFAGGSSPNRDWDGPGLDPETSPGNVIQTDDPARPIWCFRKAMMMPEQPFTLVDVLRAWNMGHQTGGGVGYQSGNATSQLPIDICSPQTQHLLPNGKLGAWDNNGVHHDRPYFQRSLCGGGYYEPGPKQGGAPNGIDWYRDTTKHFEVIEFDQGDWFFFEVMAQIMSDGSGYWTERVNGDLWIDHYKGPLHLPGVDTKYYPNNAKTSGFETIEGAYEAMSAPNLQQELLVLHTIMQAGKGKTEAEARAACIADRPVRGTGDSSRPIPGGTFPRSYSRQTTQTISDAGFSGSAPTPPPPPPAPYAVTTTAQWVEGATLGGTFTWLAVPSDVARTAKVEFLVDGVLQMGRPETTSPYGCSNIDPANSDDGKFDTILLPDGAHQFVTRATSNDATPVVVQIESWVTIHNAVTPPPPPPPPPVDVPGALADAKSSLAHLRASSGYKAAKRDNPKPASFAATQVGQSEALLVSTITKLGGTA